MRGLAQQKPHSEITDTQDNTYNFKLDAILLQPHGREEVIFVS